jgi:NitT/TauT family transport system substrate-binding protein
MGGTLSRAVLALVCFSLACSGGPPQRPAAPAGESAADCCAGAPATDGSGAAASTAQPAVVPPLSPPVAIKMGGQGLIAELGIFDAIEQGYFREEGLEVELVPFRATGEQTAPLATGELSYASFAPDPSFFNAIARGIPLKVVGYNAIINPRNDSGGWMVRQDLLDSGRYKDPSDLKGMHLTITAWGTMNQIWADRLLASAGLTVDDAQVTTLPFPDMPAAFANQAIDAGFLVEPFVSVVLGQGTARIVVPTGQLFFPGTPIQVVGISPVFAEQQPEAARRFLVAYLRGQRDYYRTFVLREGNPEDFYAVLKKYTPIQDARLYPRMTTHDVDPNGVMDPTVPNELQTYFLKYGTQQQRVDLSQVLDGSYAEYAVSRLGRMD